MKIKITDKYSIIYIRINNKIRIFIKKDVKSLFGGRYITIILKIISLEDFRVIYYKKI